jgi:hypothetical protein
MEVAGPQRSVGGPVSPETDRTPRWRRGIVVAPSVAPARGSTFCRQARWPWILAAGSLFSLVGCVALDRAPVHWPWSDAPRRGEVGQVVALWADGVVVQPDPMRGGAPTPGLAARLYLFGDQLGQPLAADGSLTVYLYDDTQPATDPPVPREVWNIDAENLQRVLRKDALGWGYNLWIPWSNYRPDIRKISLVVQYKSAQGKDAWSGATVLALNNADGGKTLSRAEAALTSSPRGKAASQSSRPPSEPVPLAHMKGP